MVLQIAEYLRKLSRKERGFTLIELVIVVAIIAILIAVAIPIYQNVTRTAAQRSHDTNLRTIDSAVSQYFMKNGSYPEIGEDATKIPVDGSGIQDFLEDVPAIPELLVGDTGDDGLKEETIEGKANEYFLHKDTNGCVWTGPLGKWKGAYRNPDGGA